MSEAFEAKLTAELEKRFPCEREAVEDVVEKVQEADEYGYTDHLDLHDVESVLTGIENWSQEQGLAAGWNRWIGVGVPDTETTHLTL